MKNASRCNGVSFPKWCVSWLDKNVNVGVLSDAVLKTVRYGISLLSFDSFSRSQETSNNLVFSGQLDACCSSCWPCLSDV